MVRNIILLISTTAVLLILFVGYLMFVGTPAPDERVLANGTVDLPITTQVADEKKLRIAGIEVDPGEDIAYITYDSAGNPTDYFRCRNWEKVPGTQDEVRLTDPELMMRLPGGMIVTITAERGQIKAERVQSKRLRPKFGWLAGNARIVVDRETGYDRTPLSERPEDQITITMDRLDFDLELGELKTADPLHVTSSEFDITGTGLHLIWNQEDNRVEKLLVENGGKMTLTGQLLASMDRSLERQRDNAPVVTQPAAPVTPAPRKKKRKPTAYRCAFSDNVSVEYFVDNQRHGALTADELTLLFDVGGRARGLPSRNKPTATAPASQPGDAPDKRIVVKWTGPLSLGPAGTPPSPDQPRRHFEASGKAVTVELPNGRLLCGRLTLHEETERIWFYPTESGFVELSSGDGLAVKAASIFIDLEADIVKLIGDVLFKSGTAARQRDSSLTIRADLWAELHLAADRERDIAENVFNSPLTSRPPESAVFVGDVTVSYEDQLLRAHRLDANFRPVDESAEPAGDTPAPRAMLESALATGDVLLTTVDASRRHDWRSVLERNTRTIKRALIRSLSTTARAQTRHRGPREDRMLTCASLHLEFGTTDGEVHIREMQGTGAVEIHDRHNRFAARGRHLTATFIGRKDLQHATVTGTDTNPALVRAQAYALRGNRINIDNQAGTLHVDGRSKLAFRSRRSLQGLTRGRPETITVTSNESMHVDLRENTVNFIGRVAAGTGNEQLLADSLTLLLEDVTERPAMSGADAFARPLLQNLFGKSKSADSSRSLFAEPRSSGGTRKELVRLLASNAAIQAETYVAGDELPLTHQSIAAPELEIDVRRRYIRTTGDTTLLMTDRRLRDAETRARSALGIASALTNSGPSQTAMDCRRGLLYMLGEEGPQRRDSVLLEGGVRFRYVTGREMAGLEELLPQVAIDPELLKTLKNQNTYMECERLECVFGVPDESRAPRAALGLRSSLAIASLNACENVYVRDQRDNDIRTIYAHQLEFDRAGGVIRILGLPEKNINVRLYDENAETGRFHGPIVSPEIIINLDTNTIEAKDIRGRAGG